jgi:hypothetical protein
MTDSPGARLVRMQSAPAATSPTARSAAEWGAADPFQRVDWDAVAHVAAGGLNTGDRLHFHAFRYADPVVLQAPVHAVRRAPQPVAAAEAVAPAAGARAPAHLDAGSPPEAVGPAPPARRHRLDEASSRRVARGESVMKC